MTGRDGGELLFAGRLALALGRTLGEVLALSAAEFAFWGEFYRRFGFPADRQEWATALAGSAVAGSNGARVEAKDLIPRFTRRRGLSGSEIVAGLAAVPGAKVERRPRAKKKEGG